MSSSRMVCNLHISAYTELDMCNKPLSFVQFGMRFMTLKCIMTVLCSAW
jgi:hypothetical protein